MKIKLGIIGPEDSVGNIIDVAREFEEKAEIFSYVYEKKEEAVDIMKVCQPLVDVVLFSGHVPYYIAKNAGVIEKPALYIPRVGTALLKVFFEMERKGMTYRRLSIDSIEERALPETIREMHLDVDDHYLITYEENIEYEKLFERHYALWKQGKIDVAITGLSKTHHELVQSGVPAMKLYPTTFLMREYISKAIYAADLRHMKSSQIGIQIVKLKTNKGGFASEYDFLKIKNKVEQQLIEYTKTVLGSVFPFGRDEYMIFSTRGVIEKHVGQLKVSDCEVASGIGYGQTVYNAEMHARIAMDYAMKSDEGTAYIMDEEGNVTGPLGAEDSDTLTYAVKVTDERVLKIAEDTKLSPAHVAKIMSVIGKMRTNEFDANDLAPLLGVSVRSTRRILGAIVDGGYGEIIAKESVSKTGRPRKVYKVDF